MKNRILFSRPPEMEAPWREKSGQEDFTFFETEIFFIPLVL